MDAGGSKTKLYVYQSKDNKQLGVTSSITCEGNIVRLFGIESLFIVIKPMSQLNSRSSPPEVFLGKGVLKICNKFTGEHRCRIVISIKFLCNFIEIPLRHRCSPVSLIHIFRTPFPNNFSGELLL